VLAYTDKDATVPMTWADSDAKIIENPQVVKLRSFDTKVYKKKFILCFVYFFPWLEANDNINNF
jgi:hypothetical protein